MASNFSDFGFSKKLVRSLHYRLDVSHDFEYTRLKYKKNIKEYFEKSQGSIITWDDDNNVVMIKQVYASFGLVVHFFRLDNNGKEIEYSYSKGITKYIPECYGENIVAIHSRTFPHSIRNHRKYLKSERTLLDIDGFINDVVDRVYPLVENIIKQQMHDYQKKLQYQIANIHTSEITSDDVNQNLNTFYNFKSRIDDADNIICDIRDFILISIYNRDHHYRRLGNYKRLYDSLTYYHRNESNKKEAENQLSRYLYSNTTRDGSGQTSKFTYSQMVVMFGSEILRYFKNTDNTTMVEYIIGKNLFQD